MPKRGDLVSRYWILLLVVFLLAAGCAYFPVAPDQCPFVAQGGYGMEHVLPIHDPECKIRCLQQLANNCSRFGPQ